MKIKNEKLIHAMLKVRPGYAYLAPGGEKLYALAAGKLICFTGKNLNMMNDHELNRAIQNTLSK